jgi:hypothetical protein
LRAGRCWIPLDLAQRIQYILSSVICMRPRTRAQNAGPCVHSINSTLAEWSPHARGPTRHRIICTHISFALIVLIIATAVYTIIPARLRAGTVMVVLRGPALQSPAHVVVVVPAGTKPDTSQQCQYSVSTV